jgi:hypothetical protein
MNETLRVTQFDMLMLYHEPCSQCHKSPLVQGYTASEPGQITLAGMSIECRIYNIDERPANCESEPMIDGRLSHFSETVTVQARSATKEIGPINQFLTSIRRFYFMPTCCLFQRRCHFADEIQDHGANPPITV